jgi:hypothetical protein
MVRDGKHLKVGDRVRAPFGLGQTLTGRVVEVWGDPPEHVRVEFTFEADDPLVLLLPPSLLTPAA